MAESHAHTLNEVRAVKPRALAIFERFVAVVGVGITRTEDEYGLLVNLQDLPSTDVVLPVDVDGVPVRVEVVGRAWKQ